MEKFLVLERRYQILCLSFIILFLLSGGLLLGKGLRSSFILKENPGVLKISKNGSEDIGETLKTGKLIVVNIKGAVRNPGIFEFPENSRVNDALKKAEVLPDGDVFSLNLAAFLTDEAEIVVPYKKDGGNLIEEEIKDAKISINQGTPAELETIPGIGPKMAAEIIAYRKKKNSFTKLEDLLNVSGIGEKTLENMLPYIKL